MSHFPIPFALLSLAGLCAAMAWAFFRQRSTKNAGVVDAIWTIAVGALGVGYVVLATGWGPRRAVVGTLVGLWSARLAWHVVRRIAAEPEDGRYRALRDELGARFDRWIFWFFQAQAVLASLLAPAFFVLAQIATPGWRIADVAAVGLWVVGLFGETLADRQLAAWRADTKNRGRTCRAGLWRYSRHPNYFFEWLMWVAYAVMAIGAEQGWVVWLTALLMLFLVLKVTGIPPTESRALESRGDDYRAYQRETNAFFPGPPRTSAVRSEVTV